MICLGALSCGRRKAAVAHVGGEYGVVIYGQGLRYFGTGIKKELLGLVFVLYPRYFGLAFLFLFGNAFFTFVVVALLPNGFAVSVQFIEYFCFYRGWYD